MRCTSAWNIIWEWKRPRTSQVMTTTKGKNERIAFAATENANVCTSVCMRYRKVATVRCRMTFRLGRVNRVLTSGSGASIVPGADVEGMESMSWEDRIKNRRGRGFPLCETSKIHFTKSRVPEIMPTSQEITPGVCGLRVFLEKVLNSKKPS